MDGVATSPERYWPVSSGTIKITAFSTGLKALNDSRTKKIEKDQKWIFNLPLVSRVCAGAWPVIIF